jgi:hypothetical protein
MKATDCGRNSGARELGSRRSAVMCNRLRRAPREIHETGGRRCNFPLRGLFTTRHTRANGQRQEVREEKMRTNLKIVAAAGSVRGFLREKR